MRFRVLALLFAPSSAFAQVDPLVHLTFDDILGVGQVVHDDSGNGFDGWSIVDPERDILPQASGDAISFDGRTDHVVMPTDAIRALADLETGSIFVRFMYEDLIATQGIVPILYVGQTDVDRTESLLVIEVGHGTALDNHKLYFTWVINGSLALCFDTDFDVIPGKMYSFVGIVGEDGNTGWLNGKELVDCHYNAGDATTSVFFNDLPNRSLQQFTIGRGKSLDGLTTDFVYLRGFVDEVQVFDEPLTPADAAALTALSPP